ncbi:MAG: hypothetical protein IIX93_10795 [Clostridia bacterium]|nr:hypothetical protein [Clostridia bacterium]
MKTVKLGENTLSRNQGMSFKEKLETARILDSIHVDVIETCAIGGLKANEILVKSVSQQTANSVVSCPVLTLDEVECAYNAVKDAKKARLNVKLPVSVVQMEYLYKKKPAAMLEMIKATVEKAASLLDDVEFTALDATRAEEKFLIQAIEIAVQAGAKTVTVSDDAGEMLPDEFGAFIKNIYVGVPELHERNVGVKTGNQLSMACACAFEAVRAGANQIGVCAWGDQPGLEEMAAILNVRGEKCGVACSVDKTALKRAVSLIARFDRAMPKETLNGAEEAAPAQPKKELDRNADIATVARAASLLGYDLSDEDLAKVYEAFRNLAGKKPVDSRELDAIVATVALQVPPTYRLSSYVVNSGNIISATAHIVLDKLGQTVQGLSAGDGPIDAAFMAIENVVGHHYELDDFEIQSVTSGREAMGEALVKLRDGGKLYSGRGISTDIIGASIRAYLNALNKIVYRETDV